MDVGLKRTEDSAVPPGDRPIGTAEGSCCAMQVNGQPLGRIAIVDRPNRRRTEME